jgi:hypothetical protein
MTENGEGRNAMKQKRVTNRGQGVGKAITEKLMREIHCQVAKTRKMNGR